MPSPTLLTCHHLHLTDSLGTLSISNLHILSISNLLTLSISNLHTLSISNLLSVVSLFPLTEGSSYKEVSCADIRATPCQTRDLTDLFTPDPKYCLVHLPPTGL